MTESQSELRWGAEGVISNPGPGPSAFFLVVVADTYTLRPKSSGEGLRPGGGGGVSLQASSFYLPITSTTSVGEQG